MRQRKFFIRRLAIVTTIAFASLAVPSARAINTFNAEISGTVVNATGGKYVIAANSRYYDGGWRSFKCGESNWLKIPSSADPALFETAREAAFYGHSVRFVVDGCGAWVARPAIKSLTVFHPLN